MINYTKIREELDSDSVLYAANKSDQEVADEFNVEDKIQNKRFLERNEVIEALDIAEVKALTPDQRATIFGVLSDTVDPFGRVAGFFTDIFPQNGPTLTKLASIRVETVSRSRQLGLGRIAAATIAIARAQ